LKPSHIRIMEMILEHEYVDSHQPDTYI